MPASRSRSASASRLDSGLRRAAPTPKEQLTVAYRDLDQRQYDSAYVKADAVLRKQPAGPGSAEALYLQGRVAEAKAEQAGTAGQSRRRPAPSSPRRRTFTCGPCRCRRCRRSRALCRCGLANAAFYLDDYQTAVREWGLAFPLVERPEDKAWVLFRVGLCQQRLGWFEMADRSFARLPAGIPRLRARRPRPRRAVGQRSFYLPGRRLLVAPKTPTAEVTRIRARRLAATRGNDPTTGRQIVRVGPFPTYVEARAAQAQLARAYPDAIVIP